MCRVYSLFGFLKKCIYDKHKNVQTHWSCLLLNHRIREFRRRNKNPTKKKSNKLPLIIKLTLL